MNTVLRAINELTAEGYSVRVKDLMEYTGLSRSVFAKPHIKELLIKKGIGSQICRKTGNDSKPADINEDHDRKDEKIRRLTEENRELKEECELLRGKLFLIMQKNQ